MKITFIYAYDGEQWSTPIALINEFKKLNWECVMSCDIDKAVKETYKENYGILPLGDITDIKPKDIPMYDILCAGFPCQPFSKSGKQMGMEETRGTLFWNIAKIIEARKPTLVLLENVRNIAGPRHIHEWKVIIKTLRDLGYRVSEDPMVVSPHLIHPEFGGRPQVRDRVFIAATRIPKGIPNFKYNIEIPSLESVKKNWDPQKWNLSRDLPLEKLTDAKSKKAVALNETEIEWIEAWNEFVVLMREKLGDKSLPGFPIWADDWVLEKDLKIPRGTPDWKENFLRKNSNS